MKSHRNIRALSIGAILVLVAMSTTPVTQMVSAAPGPAPSTNISPLFPLQGDQITITISQAAGGLKAISDGVGVHDPADGSALSFTLPPPCVEPALRPTETEWFLKRASDGAAVGYSVDGGESIVLKFGGAGDFKATGTGALRIFAAEVALPGPDLRWVVRPGSSGPNAAAPDNTGRPGTYTADSCGLEGTAPFTQSFLSTQNFVVSKRTGGEISPVDITSLSIAAVYTNTYWILPLLGVIGAMVAFFRLERKKV